MLIWARGTPETGVKRERGENAALSPTPRKRSTEPTVSHGSFPKPPRRVGRMKLELIQKERRRKPITPAGK